MVKRKLAAHDNLKITIQQNGNKFAVKESSNFRNLEINFTLGDTFEYSLADGTELSVRKSNLEDVPFPSIHFKTDSNKKGVVFESSDLQFCHFVELFSSKHFKISWLS